MPQWYMGLGVGNGPTVCNDMWIVLTYTHTRKHTSPPWDCPIFARLCEPDNGLGPEGAKALAPSLKELKGLAELHLDCTWDWVMLIDPQHATPHG